MMGVLGLVKYRGPRSVTYDLDMYWVIKVQVSRVKVGVVPCCSDLSCLMSRVLKSSTGTRDEKELSTHTPHHHQIKSETWHYR